MGGLSGVRGLRPKMSRSEFSQWQIFPQVISKFYAGSSLQIRRISADLWMLLKKSYYGVRKICRGKIRRVENSPLEKFAAGKLASGKICHWENSLHDILGLRPLTPDTH